MLTSAASQSAHIHSMQTGVVQVSKLYRDQHLLLFVSAVRAIEHEQPAMPPLL